MKKQNKKHQNTKSIGENLKSKGLMFFVSFRNAGTPCITNLLIKVPMDSSILRPEIQLQFLSLRPTHVCKQNFIYESAKMVFPSIVEKNRFQLKQAGGLARAGYQYIQQHTQLTAHVQARQCANLRLLCSKASYKTYSGHLSGMHSS